MPIVTGQTADASDFIDQSEKDATPADDAGRVPKLEDDGKLSGFFTKNGQVLNAGATINGGTQPVPLYQNKSDNEVYACDGNDLTKLKFIGFGISNGTNGNPINIQFSGVVGGFSGLSEGEKYYLSDTEGTISSTPGTYEVLVGVAISTTELFIQKGGRRAGGGIAPGISSSGSQAITIGFRPSKIRLSARIGGGIVFSFMDMLWVNGAAAGISVGMDDPDGLSISLANLYQPGSPSNFLTFTITSVTDTGFTITWTETGAFSNTVNMLWEAEGEL